MLKEKLENKRLDEIGKQLLKAASPASRDIERIVANPELFDLVRARVGAEKPPAAVRRSIFRPGVAAFASIVFVVLAGLAIVYLGPKSNQQVLSKPVQAPPQKITESQRHTQPDTVVDTAFPSSEVPVRVERASTKSNPRPMRTKQPAAQQIRYEDDFYALSYAGDPNETERGGRIVRVDIPRSTLFAMGFDIPLENEAETVKADLLVGTDGVTRAIRVVN